MRIFVFGSNAPLGIHGAGAAAYAVRKYGAVFGIGEGIQGNSYAIPTKFSDKGKVLYTLSILKIRNSVNIFLEYARQTPEDTYLVTRIGCGLAGYSNSDIAPLFEGAPDNCEFDPQWYSYGLKTWTEAP